MANQAGVDPSLLGKRRKRYAPPDASDEDFSPSCGRQDHACIMTDIIYHSQYEI